MPSLGKVMTHLAFLNSVFLVYSRRSHLILFLNFHAFGRKTASTAEDLQGNNQVQHSTNRKSGMYCNMGFVLENNDGNLHIYAIKIEKWCIKNKKDPWNMVKQYSSDMRIIHKGKKNKESSELVRAYHMWCLSKS